MTREEAIEILKDLWRTKHSMYLEADIRKALEMAIRALEPKTGHWIADVDRWGDVITTVNGYRCDKCNAFDSDKDNYCPNCGAKMVEPQERSE